MILGRQIKCDITHEKIFSPKLTLTVYTSNVFSPIFLVTEIKPDLACISNGTEIQK